MAVRLKQFIPGKPSVLTTTIVSADLSNGVPTAVFEIVEADATPPDGAVTETVFSDLSAEYHWIRAGKRVPLSFRQAARRVVDRDCGRGKSVDRMFSDIGPVGTVRSELLDWCHRALRSSVNGTTFILRHGDGLCAAGSERKRVGEYRGAFKGYARYAVRHRVSFDPDAVRTAASLLGRTQIADGFALSAVRTAADAGILEVHAVRQGRSGAEVVRLYVAQSLLRDGQLIVARTVKGTKTVVSRERKDAEARTRQVAQGKQAEERRLAMLEEQDEEARRRCEEVVAGDDSDADTFLDLQL